MPTVQVVSEVNVDLDKILDGVGQLDLAEMERFAYKVSSLVARRKAPSLPQREGELLQQRINYQSLHERDFERFQKPRDGNDKRLICAPGVNHTDELIAIVHHGCS